MVDVLLAYDGSITGDWVAHYAMRMARAGSGRLFVVHVEDGDVSSSSVAARLDRMGTAAGELGIAFDVQGVPIDGSVGNSLLQAAATHERSVVVCGLRATESGRGLLRGTVSEHLLAQARHDVLAIRVLAPGLLGAPSRALYAASIRMEGAVAASNFLAMLVPSLKHVSILRVAPVPRLRQNVITPRSRARMLDDGRAHVRRVRDAMAPALTPRDVRVESHVALASDWANEVVRYGAQVKAQLTVLGASERTLPMRVLTGNPLERVLHRAASDVAIFRKARGD